jgi:threonine dehydrogenase-like Zn-dependent dehydrogenase
LKLSGARVVYMVDPDAGRLAVARRIGLSTLLGAESTFAETRKAGLPVIDVVVEASGTYTALDQALKMVRVGGKVITVSSYGDQADGLRLGHEYHRNRVDLISSMTVNDAPHRRYPHWDLDRLNDTAGWLLECGNLDVSDLLGEVRPFHEAPAAYHELARRSENLPAKVLLQY